MDKKLKITITNRLKAIRENKGLNHADMASILGIERASYTQIEIGRNNLSVDNLVKLSDGLEVSISYILGRNEEALSSDEVELVQIYRSLSDDEARQVALKLLRGWKRETT